MKKIKARGQRIWDDCLLQQVQCECEEIFEAWTKEAVDEKFKNHKCKLDEEETNNR